MPSYEKLLLGMLQ